LVQPHGTSVQLLATDADGACVFFEKDADRLCGIHRTLGEGSLPSASRHFPRVVLSDARGTFVTLSHFCPTAAGLLFEDGPLAIVAAPDTLSLAGSVEGLDARNVLPPLLRPGMLMDLEAYGVWERCCISILEAGKSAGAALASIASATRAVQAWSPGRGSLAGVVENAFRQTPRPETISDVAADAGRHQLALASVPERVAVPEAIAAPALPHQDLASGLESFDVVIRRYLASKLFASWWPYLGLDLAGVVGAIEVHAAVLRGRLSRRLTGEPDGRRALLEAIRDTDLLMVHLSDPRTLARLIHGSRVPPRQARSPARW
jgi:hypothetical protein